MIEHLEHITTIVASLIVMAGGGLLMRRAHTKAYAHLVNQSAEALKQTAEGWKLLADQRAESLRVLEERVARLETALAHVRTENDELRRLNLSYQTELIALRERVRHLETQNGVE